MNARWPDGRSTLLWMVGVLLATLPGCGERAQGSVERSNPATLEAALVGCADVDADGTCVVAAGLPLRIWLDVPASAHPRLLEGSATVERVAGGGGVRLMVHPQPGWRTLSVVSDVGSRSFAIRPSDPLPPPLTEVQDARDAGRIDDALSRLLKVRASLPETSQVEASEIEGDLRFLGGDAKGARAAYARGATLAARRSRFHRASAMAQRIAYICTALTPDEACARRWLAADERWVDETSESQVVHDYYQALFLVRVGERREAGAALARVIERAHLLGLDALEVGALVERMLLVAEVGDWTEARRLEVRVEAMGSTVPDATAAQLANAVGWMRLQARARGRRDLPSPEPALERALRGTAADDAVSRRMRATLRLNLAYAAILDDAVDRASVWLDAFDAEPLLHDDERMWGGLLHARVALARGDLADARRKFDAVVAGADQAAAPELAWHANVGIAEVLTKQGRTAEAIERYEAASRVLEHELPKLALGIGRSHYLAERTRGTQEHVRLLLDVGRVEDALCVTRRARTRNLRSLARSMHAGPEVEDALRSYREGRTRLEREFEAVFSLPADAAEARLESLRDADGELRRALERDVFSRASPLESDCGRFRTALPGEVMVHFFELGDGWVIFAEDASELVWRWLGPRPSAEDPATVARWALAPIADQLADASSLRVMPTGWLHGVHFASLPDPMAPSDPLEARLPVVYALDVPDPSATRAAVGRGLVVAPPSNLDGASSEASAVAAALEDAVVLWGPDATAARVRELLPRASVVHFVGHAHGEGGWGGALELAHGEALDVDAVLALEQVPGLVVLAGCETGQVDRGTLAGGMSLAHAFLLAGADAVIASDDEVSDRTTAALMPVFHAEMGDGGRPAEALASARSSLAAQGMSAPSFRVWVR